LWQILALDLAAAMLFSVAPVATQLLARYSAAAGEHPGRYGVALGAATALAYVPLAAIFEPWDIGQIGPFAVFPSRLLYFAVYFFAGVGIGSTALDRGLLRPDGLLSCRWGLWSGLALATFGTWLLLAALTTEGAPAGIGPIPHLAMVANLVFAFSSAIGCLAFAAIFLRFGRKHRAIAENLSDNGYGIYLVHYVFVVWLQYMIFDLTLPAVAKAGIVVTGALLLSWGISYAAGRTAIGALLLGVGRRTVRATASEPIRHLGSALSAAERNGHAT
jgi:hypothetical protein